MKSYSTLEEKLNIRSTNINLLKFVCAIAVIISHSYAVTQNRQDFVYEISKGQCNLGGIAVAVFFFLSGLYVTKSFERNPDVGIFIKKRCIRIFPSLWIVVVLSIAVGGLITTLSFSDYYKNSETYLYLLNGFLILIHNLPGVFEHMPYQTVNGPLWTLPVEFACYIGLVITALLSQITTRINGRHSRAWWDSVAFFAVFILFIAANSLRASTIIINIIRPIAVFYTGVLYYDFRDKVILNPVAGLISLLLFFVSVFTPLFNYALILIFPYGVLSLALGTSQINDLSLLHCTYEMYLLGWPIQQMIVDYNREISPLLDWLITVPFDLLAGMLVFIIVDKITSPHKMSRQTKSL